MPDDRYMLKLYVTDITPAIQRAIETLRNLCDDEMSGCYDFEVIDIRERPQLAEDERILAVPTLVKELPPPIRRLIGDLSDREKVLLGLDLLPSKQLG
ncbi:circadian clock protein KaiB [Botrimarina sp.]|uniref:circadian clock protein KaiB n=1 Tax=Botrimarina sp. TaxID=2795802 RepID=UPI0032F02D57